MSREPNPQDPDPHVEDLDVPAEESEDVKGGAADIFAKLGDIKGESLDSKHKDQITFQTYRPYNG